MDICLITIDNNLNKSLEPKSAIGMLWLQTHFENKQWEALSNSTVIISEENSKLLIEDSNTLNNFSPGAFNHLPLLAILSVIGILKYLA